MNILLADDNVDTRALLSAAFQAKGHSVALAVNGGEAVQAAQLQQFDAVILDIEMPFVNGWQVTKILRRLPGYSTLPIILFTGYNDYYDTVKAKEAGADLVLHKPLDPFTLIKVTQGYVLAASNDTTAPAVEASTDTD